MSPGGFETKENGRRSGFEEGFNTARILPSNGVGARVGRKTNLRSGEVMTKKRVRFGLSSKRGAIW